MCPSTQVFFSFHKCPIVGSLIDSFNFWSVIYISEVVNIKDLILKLGHWGELGMESLSQYQPFFDHFLMLNNA